MLKSRTCQSVRKKTCADDDVGQSEQQIGWAVSRMRAAISNRNLDEINPKLSFRASSTCTPLPAKLENVTVHDVLSHHGPRGVVRDWD